MKAIKKKINLKRLNLVSKQTTSNMLGKRDKKFNDVMSASIMKLKKSNLREFVRSSEDIDIQCVLSSDPLPNKLSGLLIDDFNNIDDIVINYIFPQYRKGNIAAQISLNIRDIYNKFKLEKSTKHIIKKLCLNMSVEEFDNFITKEFNDRIHLMWMINDDPDLILKLESSYDIREITESINKKLIINI